MGRTVPKASLVPSGAPVVARGLAAAVLPGVLVVLLKYNLEVSSFSGSPSTDANLCHRPKAGSTIAGRNRESTNKGEEDSCVGKRSNVPPPGIGAGSEN
jgi:hypothetical protein